MAAKTLYVQEQLALASEILRPDRCSALMAQPRIQSYTGELGTESVPDTSTRADADDWGIAIVYKSAELPASSS